jgi:hypothetical protein
MTTKYTTFMAALEALCKEHGVELHPSMYDTIHVWSAGDLSYEPRRWLGHFEDRTKEDDSQ